jgi:hypothetical protein
MPVYTVTVLVPVKLLSKHTSVYKHVHVFQIFYAHNISIMHMSTNVHAYMKNVYNSKSKEYTKVLGLYSSISIQKLFGLGP